MQSNPASPDLRKHGNVLTEELSQYFATQEVSASASGAFLRALGNGVHATTMSVASDPDISFEEKGRILSVLSLLHKSVQAAFHPTVSNTRAMPQMPPLKRT